VITTIFENFLKGFLPILPVLCLLAIGCIILLFLRNRRIKGKIGEVVVNLAIKKHLSSEYKILKDVTLYSFDKDGNPDGTTQIDHIILSQYGVFAIETKNYKGWIFGDEKSKIWTQSLPGGRKYTFQNPLRQNYRHTKTISNLLKIPEHAVHSIIVLIGDCKFKTEKPKNVFFDWEFTNYVKEHKEVVFNDDQVEKFVRILEKERLTPGRQTNQIHIENLKNKRALTDSR
jgi:hypothetical protein